MPTISQDFQVRQKATCSKYAQVLNRKEVFGRENSKQFKHENRVEEMKKSISNTSGTIQYHPYKNGKVAAKLGVKLK